MAGSSRDQRVYLLASPDKREAVAVAETFQTFAATRCQVVGSTLGLDARAAIDAKADRIVVIGGDGTLIGVARSLGVNQIPLIGVNVGKLGFLVDFSVDELTRDFEQVVCDDSLIGRRAVLETCVYRDGIAQDKHPAINDCVIQAGPPFRQIRLAISIDGDHLTEVGGDGLIVCTASGSTAHNLSAGGPILQPGVDAIILTPMNPHSLTHKPLVIESDSVIDILARDVNEGTTAIIDGQVSCSFQQGDRVSIRRFESDFLLVRNPRYAKWHKLVTKLHWGRPPVRD